MEWEDGYGRRAGSKEVEGQRARSGGPGSSVQDEREKEGAAKREAEADMEGERRAEKVGEFFTLDDGCRLTGLLSITETASI